MKTYFVSYNYYVSEGDNPVNGSGNISIERETPFTNIDELNELGNRIAKHHNFPKDSVVVMNYQLLGE